jgi:hypothetical protein
LAWKVLACPVTGFLFVGLSCEPTGRRHDSTVQTLARLHLFALANNVVLTIVDAPMLLRRRVQSRLYLKYRTERSYEELYFEDFFFFFISFVLVGHRRALVHF